MPPGCPDTYPRLIGDIGGTRARFAVIDSPDSPPGRFRTLCCDDHASLLEAVHAYLLLEGGVTAPRVAAFGIANPVEGDHVQMTNHDWSFSIEQLRTELGLERLVVLNDFTALALSLPQLQADERRQIGGGRERAGRPIALLGAGTGLGVSGLVRCGNGYAPLEGEGGHVTLAASTPREAELIAVLAARFGHVSAERALSGPGLVALHDAIRQLAGAAPLALEANEISAQAIAASCPWCSEALQVFCAMLGTVAGNLALTLGAFGGVYIGGGIVPKLGDFFDHSDFRRRFEQKGRFSDYLARIPCYVILAEYPALRGAAAALDQALAGETGS